MRRHLYALAFALAACGNDPPDVTATPGTTTQSSQATTVASAPPSTGPSTSAAAGTSAAPSASERIGLDSIGELGPHLPEEPPPIEAGPASQTAMDAHRSAAVLDLLAGGEPATRLPIRATNPNTDFDFDLRDKVAPVIKPPSVRMGKTTVSAGLPPEVVQRIVRQNFGRFRLCYENKLRDDPSLAGTVHVKFKIALDGSTSSVVVTSDALPSDLRSCVGKSFYGLSFPQPEGKTPVSVDYPISFIPN
ncbi:MAG: AgmX/PglI C-terminal domain-containing protein [Polyangiaceae bacterium]